MILPDRRRGPDYNATTMVLGLVSDTHGLIRPEMFSALDGVDLILHAGDVGGSSILTELAAIAPVRAVYGNTDSPGEPHLESSALDRDRGLIHPRQPRP